ncbi:pyridoxal-phosphate dependent enzyme [Streptomyces sp. A73]|uniref:threonine synthase n=1 Tax=Streptomyces TaxID=1883 RepID=UPI00160E2CD3|nr:pyridoxal-phosphate dependent enzyme [Streptomyces sp. B15]MBQ1123448.1 pyridoxal-phosphate dependent enzyme [Streptomyces sp. B15]MBQ1162070.1 pyridoxal-phosphate dependent enzyme [Streptomyces sp. A73]
MEAPQQRDPRHLSDPRSGRRYPLDPLRWRGDDGTPLLVSPARGLAPADIETADRSLWRYRAALPALHTAQTRPGTSGPSAQAAQSAVRPVSLGEGCTPLLRRTWGGVEVGFKLEWFNPSGSFKDRGSSVMISALAAQGVGEVLEDSSGNGGSSVAAYCAAAGVDATILVPEHTSPAKTLQATAYGARVTPLPGDRDATAAAALRRAEHTVYASHNWHPYFLEGTKTLAYEIWEDLGFRAPDAVVTVAGAGSTVLGCDLGFGELLDAGQIAARPRLLVAQPANCAPLHAAFHAGRDTPVPGGWQPTLAEGTAIKEPIRLPEVLAAVRRSGGSTAAIPEADIASAVRRLAATGLYAEPTSATAAAAVEVFAARGQLQPDETTVVILTGSALKAPTAMAALVEGAS